MLAGDMFLLLKQTTLHLRAQVEEPGGLKQQGIFYSCPSDASLQGPEYFFADNDVLATK